MAGGIAIEKLEKFHFAFEDMPSVMNEIYKNKNSEAIKGRRGKWQ